MRRKDKQLNDMSDIGDILSRARVCRLGLCDGGQPYIVPLCFGYKDNSLYFHSARKGRKLDIIKANNNVCFEVEVDSEIIKADQACDWGMKYKSVVGFGKAKVIEDVESKRKGLDVIMRQYSKGVFVYSEDAVENIEVIKIEIESLTGKQSGWF